ncbi:TonB-dependent receptor [Pseudomaricurvus sp.]|uniref:TonB-dependent receptor n=1 Tax=Pseudomaricurvus sp. TaxID=2004510 RepID=UPI003F6A76DC
MRYNTPVNLLSRAIKLANHTRRNWMHCAALAPAIALSAPGAFAQDNSMPSLALEEIVVTARRKDESLQDVPQTVNAVSSETLKELNILNFQDMENVVPGVTLDTGTTGYSTSATMRGVDFSIESGVAPTVEFYLNDAPVESNVIFTQVFDVGQVEVLRGPQGTLRGRSSPSGAITVKTRDVNLEELGGYLNATGTDQGGSNYQGAINIPLIEGKLGLRVAGVLDENDVNQVESVFNDADPDADTKGYRVTLGFAPTDTFDGQLMYQKMNKDQVSFSQSTGYNDGSVLTHHNFGPVKAGDRLSVRATPDRIDSEIEATTLNLNWALGNHSLAYVGQYSELHNVTNGPQDTANYINTSVDGTLSLGGAGVATRENEWFQNLDIYQQQESHELRLTLEEPYKDVFTYTVGLFYQEKNGLNQLDSNTLIGTPDPVDGVYVLTNAIERPSETDELSAFGNATFYLSDSTELSAGVRQIRSHIWNETVVGGSQLSEIKADDNELIWNVSLSHRFNDSIMGYANVGTAVRLGPVGSLGINPLPNPDANMQKVIGQRDNEKSLSYELGFKYDFMDGRGRLNAAYYYQDFEGYLYFSKPTQYLGSRGVQTSTFTTNADATVQGIDLDASFQILENWNVSGVFSWSDSELKSPVPCNDGNLDGQPDTLPNSLSASNQVAFCDTGASASSTPDWSASVRSEYFTELNDNLETYLRGIYSYYPENDNSNRVYDNYGLLNLYVGLRDIQGVWDVQLFAKNALDEEVVTSMDSLQIDAGGTLANALGDSGYYPTKMNAPREIGVSVRYNFF